MKCGNPQPSLGFYGDLLGDPELSRVLKPPCVTVCRGMSPFTRDLFLISEAAQPPSRPAYASGGAELPLNRRGHVVELLLSLDAIAPSSGCGSPEGGRYCRLGAHRRPMPGGRLVRMDCSSACHSLTLFELRATFLNGHTTRADVERPMCRSTKKWEPLRWLPFANSQLANSVTCGLLL